MHKLIRKFKVNVERLGIPASIIGSAIAGYRQASAPGMVTSCDQKRHIPAHATCLPTQRNQKYPANHTIRKGRCISSALCMFQISFRLSN